MDGTEEVNQFMEKLDHPFKADVEMIREFIKKVNKDIAEQIKWNAPSFSYKGETLVTFNLWEKNRIHLVFHNPMISKVKSSCWKEIMTTAGWRILPIRAIYRQKGKILKKY